VVGVGELLDDCEVHELLSEFDVLVEWPQEGEEDDEDGPEPQVEVDQRTLEDEDTPGPLQPGFVDSLVCQFYLVSSVKYFCCCAYRISAIYMFNLASPPHVSFLFPLHGALQSLSRALPFVSEASCKKYEH